MTAAVMPTAAEVISATQTNADQKLDFAAMINYIIENGSKGVTAGTATAYTLAVTPEPLALDEGQLIRVTWNATSGAAPTLKVGSLAARSLRIWNALGVLVAPPAGALVANTTDFVISYGGFYVVMNPQATRYGPANILGTVSQSAGVPTGAIVQVTTSANGVSVRFADGTQICTFSATTAGVACTTGLFGGFRSAGIDWTFPQAFFSAPTCHVNANGLTAFGAEIAATPSTTIATYIFTTVDSDSAASRSATLTAIGRWF